MPSNDILALFRDHVIANYSRTPIVFTRGEGSFLWDSDGRRYVDLFPGWGVNTLGHCPPRVVAAIRDQAGRLLHVANNYYTEPQGRLAGLLAQRGFGGQSFFCNSGAEANEGAFKLARLSTPPERFKIITFENSFHGRTLAAVAATAQPKYQRGLAPLPGGFVYAPFNDLDAVRRLVDSQTCAIMVEPVQGEGGVNIAATEFLAGLRALCDREGMRLIFDEVQTGCGRLGTWFACQSFGVTPDIMTLAKGLGGGVAIGALVAHPEVAKALVPGTHASTFGGNPLACAAAIAAFETIEAEGLLEHIASVSRRALARLNQWRARFPFIRDVRGRGGMIGVELARPGAPIVKRALELGLLVNCTHDVVLRLLPALNIPWEVMEEGLDLLAQAMQEAPE